MSVFECGNDPTEGGIRYKFGIQIAHEVAIEGVLNELTLPSFFESESSLKRD